MFFNVKLRMIGEDKPFYETTCTERDIKRYATYAQEVANHTQCEVVIDFTPKKKSFVVKPNKNDFRTKPFPPYQNTPHEEIN